MKPALRMFIYAAALCLLTTPFPPAHAGPKNTGPGNPQWNPDVEMYKIMSDVYDTEHERKIAREMLEAAVTPNQFYKAVARVAYLHNLDYRKKDVHVLKNFDLNRASNVAEERYIRTLIEPVEEATSRFHSILEHAMGRTFAGSRSSEFRDYAVNLAMLAYALAVAPAGSDEHQELRKTLVQTSEDLFHTLRAILSFTDIPVESALQDLKPWLAKLIPEKNSRDAFLQGLKNARKSLSITSGFLPNPRLGLPKDTATGWVAYGMVTGLANLFAWHFGTTSGHEAAWFAVANGALVAQMLRNGGLKHAIDVVKTARDYRRSEKVVTEISDEPQRTLEPPKPPPTSRDAAKDILNSVMRSSRMAVTPTCSALFVSDTSLL